MVCDHIVLPADSAGFLLIAFFHKQELRIRDPAVTLVAGYELPPACFIRVLNVGNNVTDRRSNASPLPTMKWHQTCCSQRFRLLHSDLWLKNRNLCVMITLRDNCIIFFEDVLYLSVKTHALFSRPQGSESCLAAIRVMCFSGAWLCCAPFYRKEDAQWICPLSWTRCSTC